MRINPNQCLIKTVLDHHKGDISDLLTFQIGTSCPYLQKGITMETETELFFVSPDFSETLRNKIAGNLKYFSTVVVS